MIIFSLLSRYALTMFEWCIAHWRVILIALMVLAIWHYKTSYEASVEAFDSFKAEIDNAVEQRKYDDAKKLAKAEADNAVAEAEYKAQLDKFNLDRKREATNLKDLYETRLDTTGRNWSERVRLEAMRKNSTAEGDTASNPNGSTEVWRECDGAFTTLEKACQITTIDFNRARKWIDAACEQVGCKQ